MPEAKYLFHPEDSAPSLSLGGQNVDYKVGSRVTEGRLAIVEQPLAPGRLVPPHLHRGEDELSYVLEGEIGCRIGDQEGSATQGCYIWKPRGMGHALWNASSRWAKIIEIITPGGFEEYFKELAELAKLPGGPHMERRADIGSRYNIEYLPEWASGLMNRYDVRLPGQ
jgi:quercetin dioxygenase-like cupin family protein